MRSIAHLQRRSASLFFASVLFSFGLLLSGCSPAPVTVPKSFAAYSPPDNSFTCLAPTETAWEKSRAGMNGLLSSVYLKCGDAIVDIKADLQGSLAGDIAQAQNNQAQSMVDMLPSGMQKAMPTPRPPVEQLHMAGGARLLKKYDDYNEGTMKPFRSVLGDARVSEWQRKEKHGYRATILGGEKRFTIVCACREKDWKAMRPSFQKIIASVSPGKG